MTNQNLSPTQYRGKKETMEQRVSGLEEKNTVAEKIDEEGRIITVKEVFERVVALETRLDALRIDNRETADKFAIATYVILVLLVIDLVISILIHAKFQGAS